MSQIKRTDVIQEIVNTLGLGSMDKVPNKMFESVMPVIDLNPNHNRIVNIVRAANLLNATSTTIFTTPTGKDFFLTGACLSFIKDVTSTSTTSTIEIKTEDGTVVNIIRLASLTLTVQDQAVSISLPFPIKLFRNSVITLRNDTGIANIATSGSIWGYTVEQY